MLSELGHDVLTVQSAGQANQKIPDDRVLAYATRRSRSVLTVNRSDFIKLHKQNANHAGIIVCTEDMNRTALSSRIHAAISQEKSLKRLLIRINRPSL